MTTTCWDKFSKGGSTVDFLKARAIRIIPLYWIFTIITFGIALIFPAQTSIVASPLHLISSLFFIPISQYPIVKVGWTLNFEVYFYIIFSILLLLKRRNALILGIAILICTQLINLLAIKPETPYIFKLLSSPLLLEFSLGCLVGITYRLNYRTSLSPIALTAGLLMLTLFYSDAKTEEQRVLHWGLASTLIVAGVTLQRQTIDIVNHNKSTRILVQLGDSSYMLYISHPILMPVIGKVWAILGLSKALPPQVYLITSLILLASISHLLHVKMENPVNRFLKYKLFSNSYERVEK